MKQNRLSACHQKANGLQTTSNTHGQTEKSLGFQSTHFVKLSPLHVNNHVYWKFFWRDFGDLEELNTGVVSGMSYADVPTMSSGIPLLQEHLEQAREIHLARSSFGEKRRHLDTAVSRWIKSKRSNASLADKFIDLRIALEALYLEDDNKTEKGFRLATRGAWHLGADFTKEVSITKRFVIPMVVPQVLYTQVKIKSQRKTKIYLQLPKTSAEREF